MDSNVRIAQELQIEHRHSDGSWSPMVPSHHESADHDAERSWLRRRIFGCETCDEQVSVTAAGAEDDDEPIRR